MTSNDVRNLSRARGIALPLLASLVLCQPSDAGAAPPYYHMTRLDIAGASNMFVADINDAGEMVGYYVDDTGNHAFLWDAAGAHNLAAPTSPGAIEVDTAATAINNAGQIVGYAQVFNADDTVSSPGVLWTHDHPDQVQLLSTDPSVALTPRDISDNGTVVGLKANPLTGEAFHGFVWTAADGLVDYGTTDSTDPSVNASWTAVNDAGQLIGVWNFQFSPAHAAIGTVGTPAMLPLGAASDAVESGASAINASGSRVGYMDIDASGHSVPVVFGSDGSATAIAGATLGLAAGQALGINDAGVIVGRADDFSTLAFKAFVAIDGSAYDLLEQADDNGGLDYLLTAQAVNASGAIVGVGRYGDLQVGSYLLTPISDAIFSDGFDP